MVVCAIFFCLNHQHTTRVVAHIHTHMYVWNAVYLIWILLCDDDFLLQHTHTHAPSYTYAHTIILTILFTALTTDHEKFRPQYFIAFSCSSCILYACPPARLAYIQMNIQSIWSLLYVVFDFMFFRCHVIIYIVYKHVWVWVLVWVLFVMSIEISWICPLLDYYYNLNWFSRYSTLVLVAFCILCWANSMYLAKWNE